MRTFAVCTKVYILEYVSSGTHQALDLVNNAYKNKRIQNGSKNWTHKGVPTIANTNNYFSNILELQSLWIANNKLAMCLDEMLKCDAWTNRQTWRLK